MKKCPDCNSISIVEDEQTHELICLNCGLVLEDNILDRNPYLTKSKRKSAKLPIFSKAESFGKEGKFVKNSWLMTTREKNIKDGFNHIEDKCVSVGIPSFVSDEAKKLFKITVELNFTIGRNIENFVYASIYAACIINNIPKLITEIIGFENENKKNILRAYILMKRKFNLRNLKISANDLVLRYATKLKLNNKTIMKTVEIIERVEDLGLMSGKKIETILASCLYLASKLSNDYRTQRQITNATGVIEFTIRRRSKEIERALVGS